VNKYKCLLCVLLLLFSFVSCYSQERGDNTIVQFIQSYTTPSADGKLYNFNVKLVWKIVDSSLFLKKYSGIDFYKKILEVDTKTSLLKEIVLYQAIEIEAFIPTVPSDQSKTGYRDLKKKLLAAIEYDGKVKKEPSIELISIDLVLIIGK